MSDTAVPTRTVLAVIGGSGVYQIDALENPCWEKVTSPWGETSDEFLFGTLNGVDMIFVPRHGRGHRHSPQSVPYRANIDALKRAGATDIISVSAVGSLREDLPPGHFVLVDQFIDRTIQREKSFFGEGCVAHVSMAHPTCTRLMDALEEAGKSLALPMTRGGTYLAMEGPQFSSFAESQLYRSWGCSVIGMTNMPEAKLAREAELPYATVAMVTDYDCWHEGHDNVDVATVIRILQDNADKARALLAEVAPKLGPQRTACPLGIETCLDTALITQPAARDASLVSKLDAVAGRVLGLEPRRHMRYSEGAHSQ